MGGGGSGRSTTENTGQYPPEFQPLAKSAVEQIQAFQNMLPLTSFAPYQPQGVAQMSPIEQFGANELVMRTPYLPDSLKSVYEMPEAINVSTEGIVRAGGETQDSRRAQQALDRYLAPRFPSVPDQYRQGQAIPKLTTFPMPETAFPGLTAQALEQARMGGGVPGGGGIAQQPTPSLGGGIANQPVPVVGGGPPPAMGPPPAPPAAPQPTTAVTMTEMYRSQLPPYLQADYDFYIANGFSPVAAFDHALLRSPYEGGTTRTQGGPLFPGLFDEAMMRQSLAAGGGGGGGGDEGAGQGP